MWLSVIKWFIWTYTLKFKELTPEKNPKSDDDCVKDDFSVYIFMNKFI